MAIGLAQAHAQDVKIEFITPSIVHVVKGQPTKTLVITAKPEQVNVIKKGNTTSSKELTVKQDAQGNLTFLTAKGKVLLREKSCDVKEARQTFTLDKDEAIAARRNAWSSLTLRTSRTCSRASRAMASTGRTTLLPSSRTMPAA